MSAYYTIVYAVDTSLAAQSLRTSTLMWLIRASCGSRETVHIIIIIIIITLQHR